MRILFTNRSRLIAWALDEPFSHVAIEYKGMVYHSKSGGITVEPLSYFLKTSTISTTLTVKNNWLKLFTVVQKNWNAPYDWRAFLHLGARALVKKATFGLVKLPKADLWHATGMFICTEFVTEVINDNEEQLTPFELYRRMRE